MVNTDRESGLYGSLPIQWNLSITDILTPDIFGHLLQYRGFPLLEVENVLVTPVGTKTIVLIMEVFSFIHRVLREVPLYYEFLVLYSSKFLWSKNFSLFCVKSQPQIFLQYRLNRGLIENQGIFRGHNSLELYDTINDKSYLREKKLWISCKRRENLRRFCFVCYSIRN